MHEEVEPSARRIVAVDDPADLDDVTAQAFELLIDIQSLQHQRQLLLQPVAIQIDLQFGEPLVELEADARLNFGQAAAYLRHQGLHRSATLLQQLAQSQPHTNTNNNQNHHKRVEK